MSTPHNGDVGNQTSHSSSEQALSGAVGTAEHCLRGVTGFLITGAVIAPLYPTLVAATRPLHLLSSTALVVILITVWMLTWFALEYVLELRAGRSTAES